MFTLFICAKFLCGSCGHGIKEHIEDLCVTKRDVISRTEAKTCMKAHITVIWYFQEKCELIVKIYNNYFISKFADEFSNG